MDDEFLTRFREPPRPEFASRLRRRLKGAALLLGGLLYGLFYPLVGVMLLLFTTSQIRWPIFWADFLYLYPRSLLFSRPWLYGLTSLGALTLAVGALWWGKPGKVTRWLLYIIIGSILVTPFAAAYRPAVTANPGYTLLNATQPPFLLGPTKSAQVGAEIHRCSYTLLGWAADTLYYQEDCEDARTTWRYTPSMRRGTPVAATPDVLAGVPATQADLAVGARTPYKILTAAGILTSSDGRWHAFVAQHSYGPEDVLLISTTPSP